MATYRELHGKALKTVTTNPSDDAAEGQIWFNSTDNTFKSAVASGVWHSTAARLFSDAPAGQGGTQNAAWTCGDDSPPGTNTEEYNGTGWSVGGTLNTARRYGHGWGAQTAAITASGSPPSGPNTGLQAVEEYNGTAWTASTSVPSPYARYLGGSIGSVSTAGAIFCGSQNPPNLDTTVEWNGSSWTGGGNYPFSGPVGAGAGCGTLTAGLFMGGPGAGNVVCKYDGTNWTTTTNYPASKGGIGAAGTQTAAIGFGGSPATTNAFLFDGSTFTATGSLGLSNPSGAFGIGGSSPSTTTVGTFSANTSTEEFNQSATVITASAWAAGGNLNTARTGHRTATNSAADTGLCFGGNYPSGTDNSEEYNGTTWSEGNNLPQALSFMGGAGTQTAGLSFTGRQNPGSRVNNTYEYNGTSWTESPGTYGAAQAYSGGAGTQTAALGVAGETPPGTDLTTSYEYNGSTWTAGNACNVPGYDALVFGTSAGAHMACLTGPPTNLETEEYDGTNWTASATAIRSQNQGGASGTYPIGLIFGGASSAPSTSTQGWDGTAWSTRPSLSTARRAKGSGVTAQALAQGGETPPGSASNATEELGPETTSLNIETLTQS